MPALSRLSTILLSSCTGIAVSATALRFYLHDHPLSSALTHRITASEGAVRSQIQSKVLRELSSPQQQDGTIDWRCITLGQNEVNKLSDEQVLAAFTKGFFGGWMFVPERVVFAAVKVAGVKALPAGFGGLAESRSSLTADEISTSALPPKNSPLFDRFFTVLDYHVESEEQSLRSLHSAGTSGPSFVEIGYGNPDGSFRGVHRFEVSRFRNSDSDQAQLKVTFSSFNRRPQTGGLFPGWVWRLHQFYSLCLFRDGIREVLEKK